MAKMDVNYGFTGSLGDLSFYRMKGVDKVIVRSKGGPSRAQIQKSPKFESTRKLNAEFGGRAVASKWIMQMLWPQKALADYNIAGPLNSIMRHVQNMDTEYPQGERSIILSTNRQVLEEFPLNRQNSFNTIIRTALTSSFSREECTATLQIPELLPGISFVTREKHPMFSIQAVLGIVPDLMYDHHRYRPVRDEYASMTYTTQVTPWHPVLKGAPATELKLKLGMMPPNDAFTLMLSVGIRFGTLQDAATIVQVPNAGAAKILALR